MKRVLIFQADYQLGFLRHFITILLFVLCSEKNPTSSCAKECCLNATKCNKVISHSSENMSLLDKKCKTWGCNWFNCPSLIIGKPVLVKFSVTSAMHFWCVFFFHLFWATSVGLVSLLWAKYHYLFSVFIWLLDLSQRDWWNPAGHRCW